MSDGRQPLDREAGFLSDADDELLDFQKSSKLSELYSATVPSIDSAMSSWDSSGFDAAYGSQGEAREDSSQCAIFIPRVSADGLTERLPVFSLKGRISTKPPISCSIRAIGGALSTAAKQVPALRVLCITRPCMMGGSLKTSGIRFLGEFAQHCQVAHLVFLCQRSFECS